MSEVSRRTILRTAVVGGAVAVFSGRAVASAATAPAAGQAAATTMALSYAELDVTPTTGDASGWMGGYGWHKRGNPANFGNPPWPRDRELRAQCVVLWDAGWPNVLLRVDVVSIPPDIHREIRRRVVQVNGYVATDSDFLLTASHTHSGPFVGDTHPDPVVIMGLGTVDPNNDVGAVNTWTSHFIDLMVETVAQAVAAPRTPVTLGYALGNATISVNRVDASLGILTDLPVVVARSATDNSVQAVLFGYACHPVCKWRGPWDPAHGQDVCNYDSDWPGAASELVRATFNGAPVLFFQGAAGDLNPAEGDPGGSNPAAVTDTGTALGNAVVNVVNSAAFAPVIGPISTAYYADNLQLPFAVDLSDPGVRSTLIGKYNGRLNPAPGDEIGAAAARHARIMINRLSNPATLDLSVAMPLQCWRLGGLTILALAHEVLTNYHRQIQAAATGPVWVMAYANEVALYVPPDNVSWQGGNWNGGYEAGWNGSDPDITGVGTNLMAYGWPAPLRSSAPSTDPADPASTEGLVMAACLKMLQGNVP